MLKSLFQNVLTSAVVAGSLLCFCACDQSPATNSGDGDITIGFIVKQPEEPWFQLEWQFARECAAEHGFRLMEIGAVDGEKALTAIDTLAASGAQGFVICTPDVKLGPAIMQKAKVNNLKVIAVDDQFLNADGSPMKEVHYLGISARKIGEDVGEQLWKEMQNRGWNIDETAAGMVTFDELETARERTGGGLHPVTGEEVWFNHLTLLAAHGREPFEPPRRGLRVRTAGAPRKSRWRCGDEPDDGGRRRPRRRSPYRGVPRRALRGRAR